MGKNMHIKQVPAYQELLVLLEQILDLLREQQIESEVIPRIEMILEICS